MAAEELQNPVQLTAALSVAGVAGASGGEELDAGGMEGDDGDEGVGQVMRGSGVGCEAP